MSENKRGAVLVIQAGDAQITEALTDGIRAGRAARLSAAQIQTVEAEIDRQAIADSFDAAAVARRMRVAMHPEPVDYAGMIEDARAEYTRRALPRWLRKALEKLLIGYALTALAIVAAFRAQDKVLGGTTWPEN